MSPGCDKTPNPNPDLTLVMFHQGSIIMQEQQFSQLYRLECKAAVDPPRLLLVVQDGIWHISGLPYYREHSVKSGNNRAPSHPNPKPNTPRHLPILALTLTLILTPPDLSIPGYHAQNNCSNPTPTPDPKLNTHRCYAGGVVVMHP